MRHARSSIEATHGGPDLAELARLGIAPDSLIDFSTNVNPFHEPSSRLRATLTEPPLHRYPDPRAVAFRRALASAPEMGRASIDPDQIVVGNGCSELIWLTALAFLQGGDRALIVGPTYGEYARAAAIVGAEVHHVLGRADEGYRVVAEDVSRAVAELRPRAAFICNPNNPTGQRHPTGRIAAISRESPNTLFVIDESYWEFGPREGTAIGIGAANVLVLRSMTKAYGLAGLRLGYGVGCADVVASLRNVAPPWSVNAPAQAAGVAVLADRDGLERSLAELARAKAGLIDGLVSIGLAPLPSAAHFFLVRVGDGGAVRRTLLPKGFLVRDCASFGLPEFIRLSPQRPDQNARLVEAMAGLV